MSENADRAPLGRTDADAAGAADLADLAEQNDDITEIAGADSPTTSLEVDEFDAAEQGRTVDLDPDEYR